MKKLLTILLSSLVLFSCSSDDSDDLGKLAEEKIWVFVSTDTLIKKCEITVDGETVDLLDMLGWVTLDSGENIMLWSKVDASFWQVYLKVAEPLEADVTSSVTTVNKGEMLFIEYIGSGNFSISTDLASNHLNLIEDYYNEKITSSIQTEKTSIQKQNNLIDLGTFSK